MVALMAEVGVVRIALMAEALKVKEVYQMAVVKGVVVGWWAAMEAMEKALKAEVWGVRVALMAEVGKMMEVLMVGG